MMERGEIERRLGELRGELERAQGGPTEVYSRIVGYYRSVRNWNAGKREEYAERRSFAMSRPAAPARAEDAAPEPRRRAASPRKPALEAGKASPRPALPAAPRRSASSSWAAAAKAAATVPAARLPAEASGSAPRKPASPLAAGGEVFVFTRETCPNCPPVADFVATSGIDAVFVDVDVDEGLALARAYDVLATPTVLALDENGAELFRACDLGSVKAAVSARLVPARLDV